jgi:hypothetical protein
MRDQQGRVDREQSDGDGDRLGRSGAGGRGHSERLRVMGRGDAQ